MGYDPNEPRDEKGQWTNDNASNVKGSGSEAQYINDLFGKKGNIQETETSFLEDVSSIDVKNYGNTVSQKETEALKSYLNDPTFYKTGYLINTDARNGTLSKDQKLEVQSINKFLDGAPKFNQPTYRGLVGDKNLERFTNVVPGDIFTDKGFVSTSASPKIFQTFGQNLSDSTSILMKINGKNGVYVRDYSESKNEREVLFKTDTKFQVLRKVDYSKGGKKILFFELKEI